MGGALDEPNGTTTQVVVVCPGTGSYWYEGGEEPGCNDPAHDHQRIEVHRHRTVVTLPDGTEVVGVSFDPTDPYGRDPDRTPAYGLYLDPRWQPPWPHDLLDWPDFGVPADPAPVLAALQLVLDRARAGDRVELGCLGAHGRTGTALACLATLTGLTPAAAIPWTRTNYCPKAIETPAQESFVTAFPPS